MTNRSRMGVLWLALAAGCGGRSDPYDRVATAGTVQLDGQPAAYAQIFIESEPDEKNRSAKTTIRVVNGTFEVDSNYGPTPGDNAVSIALYTTAPKLAENPEEEDIEGDLVGTWTGTVNVQSGQPLDFVLNSKELQK